MIDSSVSHEEWQRKMEISSNAVNFKFNLWVLLSAMTAVSAERQKTSGSLVSLVFTVQRPCLDLVAWHFSWRE